MAAGVSQIHEFEQRGEAFFRGVCGDAFHCSKIFQEFQGVKVRVYAKVLRQIAEHRAQHIRIPRDDRRIPKNPS